MPTNRPFLMRLGLASLLALLGPTPTVDAGFLDWSYSRYALPFDDRDTPEVFQQMLRPSGKQISVGVGLKVESGVVAWRLTDRYGRVQWRGHVEGPGRVKEKRIFTESGTWRLELIFERATGRYAIKLGTR